MKTARLRYESIRGYRRGFGRGLRAYPLWTWSLSAHSLDGFGHSQLDTGVRTRVWGRSTGSLEEALTAPVLKSARLQDFPNPSVRLSLVRMTQCQS